VSQSGRKPSMRKLQSCIRSRGAILIFMQAIHYKHFNKTISKRRAAFKWTRVADRSESLLTYSIVSNYPLIASLFLPASLQILNSKNNCRI
jgi:hypothetical protein